MARAQPCVTLRIALCPFGWDSGGAALSPSSSVAHLLRSRGALKSSHFGSLPTVFHRQGRKLRSGFWVSFLLCLLGWRLGALVLPWAAGCTGGGHGAGSCSCNWRCQCCSWSCGDALLWFVGSVSKVPWPSPAEVNL